MSTGSLTDDKANELVALWGHWVDGRHQNLELCRAAGLEMKKAIGAKDQDLDEAVDLGDLADDKVDEGQASSSGTLKVGDHVTVCRRFFGPCPSRTTPTTGTMSLEEPRASSWGSRTRTIARSS